MRALLPHSFVYTSNDFSGRSFSEGGHKSQLLEEYQQYHHLPDSPHWTNQKVIINEVDDGKKEREGREGMEGGSSVYVCEMDGNIQKSRRRA